MKETTKKKLIIGGIIAGCLGALAVYDVASGNAENRHYLERINAQRRNAIAMADAEQNRRLELENHTREQALQQAKVQFMMNAYANGDVDTLVKLKNAETMRQELAGQRELEAARIVADKKIQEAKYDAIKNRKPLINISKTETKE